LSCSHIRSGAPIDEASQIKITHVIVHRLPNVRVIYPLSGVGVSNGEGNREEGRDSCSCHAVPFVRAIVPQGIGSILFGATSAQRPARKLRRADTRFIPLHTRAVSFTRLLGNNWFATTAKTRRKCVKSAGAEAS
jgi:hypothetical protein